MTYDAVGAAPVPVVDWLHDWDFLDPAWGPDAIEIWNSIRAAGGVATTDRYGRVTMPVDMATISAMAYDIEHFSSEWVTVAKPDAPRRVTPPITSDPPEHHDHRRLLLPAFSPKAISRLEPRLRAFCRELIADLRGRVGVDAAMDYAQHIPVYGICALLGLPESDADMFREWIHLNFQVAPRDNAVRQRVYTEMSEYVLRLLAERRVAPMDDLLSFIATAEIDGAPVSLELQAGYVQLMIIAGVDTTWSAIGSGLWHFAQHPDDRQRLVASPADSELWGTATEEILRYYAPVTIARKVVADADVAGCPVHAGEQVVLTFPAANHDPAEFEDPARFDIERQANRHVAFGLGIHRCIGSNLARMELTVALQEWIHAFPDYELDPTRPVTWANGQVRGPRTIPVRLVTEAAR